MRWGTCLLVAGVTIVRVSSALACSTCGCGDPTLTPLGTEKPYENRVRASLELRLRTEELGRANVDRISMQESRLAAYLAWAPHERVFLLLTTPLIHRTVTYVNEARAEMLGLADIDLRVKGFVAQDSSAFPKHLLAISAGLKLPTTPLRRGADGAWLPMELQMGTGSWDPLLGVSYAYFPRPWSLYASAQATVPLRDTSTFRASPSLRASLSVQHQLSHRFAARLGIDTRIDGKAYESGKPERDSGGLIGFVSSDLLFGLSSDLLLVTSVHLPVLQALSGYHRENVIWSTGLSLDL